VAPCYHETVTPHRRTVLWLGVYAAAMAWLEAAVVVYLRRLYYPDDLLTLFPMRVWRTSDLMVELARETATIVMILAVALLAVPGRTRRIAAFLYVFGVWDLCYYLWLKLALGWPVSWTDWDILFLIPWAWLAPWFTPAVAALLFTLWGGGVLARKTETEVPRRAWHLVIGGLTLMLASFLEPSLPLLGQSTEAAAQFVPSRFLWAAYLPGAALLASGLFIGRPRRIAVEVAPLPPTD
jgi:hypothetical protein